MPEVRSRVGVRRAVVSCAVALGLCGAVAPAATAASCTPGTWTQYHFDEKDRTEQKVRYESEHFVIRLSDGLVSSLSAAEAQAALGRLEGVWRQYMTRVGWPEPFCGSSQKYKANVTVFAADGPAVYGGGRDEKDLSLWLTSAALRSSSWELAHEFAHALQVHSRGNAESVYTGWFWESHAQFMARQTDAGRVNAGPIEKMVWNPWVYWGSTRNRYDNFLFLEYLKNKYGYRVVNDMWLRAPKVTDPARVENDPILRLRTNEGWSQSRLDDEFGEFAMRNVTWDYVDPDGHDYGAALRAGHGDPSQVRTPAAAQRATRLDAIDDARSAYVVPTGWAPQRYGYNHVRLYPAAGASSVTVRFSGVVQDRRPLIADLGRFAFEPGNDGNPASAPAPDSGWRWGVVSIKADGSPRYSELKREADGTLTVPVAGNDRSMWLVVVGAPTEHHKIFWDQQYRSLYRYPYKVRLDGAKPEGYQPGSRTPAPGGRFHPNGGGWVSDTARVAATAYVGPHAKVLGGTVEDNARIEDFAIVQNGTVRGNAVVGGISNLINNATVEGNARVATTMSLWTAQNPRFGGDVTLYGDLENYCPSLTRGAFSGWIAEKFCTDPGWGAERSGLPGEVTAAIPAGMPPSFEPVPPRVEVGPPVALTPDTQITLQPQAFAGYRVRHQSFGLRIDPVDASSPQLARDDATFTVRRGLAGGAGVSLESVNYPGHFLSVGADRRGVLRRNDGSAAFAADATFLSVQGLNGQGVSFALASNPGLYLRHSGSVVSATTIGDSLGRSDATFVVRPPFDTSSLAVGRKVALQSVNYPAYRVRQQNGALRISPIDASSPQADRDDSSFKVGPGLAGSGISLESVSRPGLYVRIVNGAASLAPKLNTKAFADLATFTPREGLAGKGVSLALTADPAKYLRHAGYLIWLQPFDGSQLGRDDASFTVVSVG